jgi:hypothetical protein
MAKDWPGITDKAAFCSWLSHEMSAKGLAEKSFSLRLPIAKYDDQNGIVTGWAALSSANDKPLIDFHNELCLVSELEKAAHSLMLEGGAGKAGEMHAERVGDVVESMVLSKEKALALGLGDVKTEGWIVSLKLRDSGAIQRVKDGERNELSIHGMAKRIPVGERDGQPINALIDLSVDEISVVDEGASGNEDAKPKIVIAKRREPEAKDGLGARFVAKLKKLFGKEENTMNLDDILAKLSEEERAFLLSIMEGLKAEAAPETPPDPAAAEAAKQEGGGEGGGEGGAGDEDKDEMTAEQMAKVVKNLPPSIRKQIEDGKKAKSETDELRKRLDERDERDEVAKFRGKAEAFKFLAGQNLDEIGKLLRAASKAMTAKEYEAIEKLLSNANDAVKASPLFKDLGGRGNDSETTAEGKLRGIAKALRDADPNLSAAQAVAKAREENPELRRQATAELQGG